MEHSLTCLYLLLELQSLCWVMDAFVPRRFHDRKYPAAFWLSYLGMAAFTFFTASLPSLPSTIAAYSAHFLILFTLYRFHEPLFIVLLTMIYWLFSYLVQLGVDALGALFLGMSIIDLWTQSLPAVVCAIVGYLVTLGLCAAVRQLHPLNAQARIQWPRLVLTMLFPAASFFILLTLVSAALDTPSASGAVMLCSLFLAFANFALLSLISWMGRIADEQVQTQALAHELEMQRKSIAALSRAYAEQRRLTHDYNAHIEALQALAAQKDLPAIDAYLQTLHEKHTTRSLLVNSRNPVLDAVLNQKAYRAKECGILLHVEINDLSALPLDAVDMTAILANLLDNAIEACQRCGGVKQLHLKVLLGSTLFLSVRNTSPPVRIINNSILSTKPQPELHGFGLQNVKALFARYRGDYTMQYADGWFLFAGELPLS